MAETKTKKPKKVKRFLKGGNLANGKRFEAGQIVPKLTKAEAKALKRHIAEDG